MSIGSYEEGLDIVRAIGARDARIRELEKDNHRLASMVGEVTSMHQKACAERDQLRAENERLINEITNAKKIFALAYTAASNGICDEAMLHCGIGEARLSKVMK